MPSFRNRAGLGLAVLGLVCLTLPVAAQAGRFDAACTGEVGNVPPGYELVDIQRVESRQDGEAVIITLSLGAYPYMMHSDYSITVDYKDGGEPDLYFRNDAGGTFEGRTVIWPAYPKDQGQTLTFRLASTEHHEFKASSVPGNKWVVTAHAASYTDTDQVVDTVTCAGPLTSAPGPAAVAAIGTLLVAALVRRRR